MKKRILFLAIVLFCLSTVSFAQFKYGIKGGLVIANQKWSASGISITPDGRNGAAVGAFFKFQLADNFALQPELLYVMKGTNLDAEMFDGEFGQKVSLKHDYLSVPVIAKLYSGGFNVQAGPSFDFLVSSKVTANGMEEDVKDSFKGFDLGLAIGLGYDFPMGLMFEARYVLGVTDMNNEPEMEGIKMTNNCFMFTLGFTF